MALLSPVNKQNKTLTARLHSYFNRKTLSIALVMVGIVLLGYVAGEYWGMYRSQVRLEAEWERQSAAVTTPGQPGQPAQPGQRKLLPGQMLTRVVIPKIGMDAIVVEGTSHKALSAGPGHLEETAMPGEPGNAVITAHRDTFFRHIYELDKGDEIQVRRNGRLFTYQVTGKKVVPPQDLSVIKQTTDSQLTLITCYPTYYIGPAPERLVVFSRLVEDGHPGKQAAQTRSSGQ
jgi:sortase A